MRKSLKSVRYSVPIKTLLALTLTVPASADVLANNESSTSLSTQQNQSVQGRIVDEYGEPLIGVTVRALNGNKATVTDLDGKYTLQIPRGAKVKLSYTGYKDKVITAGGIHGVIKEINDNDVMLEIDRNVKVCVDKNSIFAAAADANANNQTK